MDMKATFKKYSSLTQVDDEKEKYKESIEIIKSS